jgi:membrane protease YdiL (CAAX protease family)
MSKVFLDAQGAVRNGWKVVGHLAILMALGLLFSPLLRLLPLAFRTVIPRQWLEFLLYLLAAWICLRAERQPLASLGFRLDRRFGSDFLLGTLGGFILMVSAAGIVWGAGGVHWLRTPGVGLGQALHGAWLYLAVAFAEETLFRGYLFQRSVRGMGVTATQVVFAAAFALAHWSNPGMAGATKLWATVNIALAALLLGFCYLRTGSLALPIGVHLGWNWTQGNLLGFGVSGTTNEGWFTPIFHGRPEWLTGGAFGLEGGLPGVLICGAAVLGMWLWKGTVSAGSSTASAS